MIEDAREYLVYVKSLVISTPQIIDIKIVREEIQGKIGLYRYRLSLVDGGLLEVFERFEVTPVRVNVLKYSFQWQDADHQLRKRWDNAGHHPEVSTHPHHVHLGPEDTVFNHRPMTLADVLNELDS